jgi:MFS family permease
MVTRFLLGSCESGFIPASLFTISRFYKRDETSKRFAYFFMGNHFAQATSGLIAYVRELSSHSRSETTGFSDVSPCAVDH